MCQFLITAKSYFIAMRKHSLSLGSHQKNIPPASKMMFYPNSHVMIFSQIFLQMIFTSILLTVLVLFSFLGLVVLMILRKSLASVGRKKCGGLETAIVLGSGGHTTEMIRLISAMDRQRQELFRF